MAIPIITIFSGRSDPQLSTLKKNLFGLASQLKGASSKQDRNIKLNYILIAFEIYIKDVYHQRNKTAGKKI